jgi:LCP family protein required for cell wall assembly
MGRMKTRIFVWSVVGLLVVVAGVAAGYYLWLNAKVSAANERVSPDVREALAEHPTTTAPPATSTTVDSGLTTTTERAPAAPNTMNILVLGSDRRSANSDSYGLSDTIMVVHVDPRNNYLSTISFPRDLRVSVSRHGKQKLNAAYSYGGPALSIRTIKAVSKIDIDHYLEVDFQAFRDMTDSLGGVYVEVDRRYYYNGGQYERINLQPGYRLLTGPDALDYVRFRHDSNLDFGRMERQQRFLSALRQQAMGWDLGVKLPKLIGAFFDNVATDLGTNDFLRLAWWGVRLDGERVKQVTLRGATQTIGGASYVIASQDRIDAAVQDFLTPPGDGTEGSSPGAGAASTTTEAEKGPLAGIELDVRNSTGPSGSATSAASFLRSQGAKVVTVSNATQKVTATQVWYPAGALATAQKVAKAIETTTLGQSAAVERVTVILGSDYSPPGGSVGSGTVLSAAVWRAVASKVPFAVQAPTYLPSEYIISKRSPNNATIYKIKVGSDSLPTLVMLYKLGGADQYMNITETTWQDAPLASPGKQVEHGGTTFTVVFAGDKVERVWWKSDGVLYWVSNTLSHLATEQELMGVAESMVRVSGQ